MPEALGWEPLPYHASCLANGHLSLGLYKETFGEVKTHVVTHIGY
jgi:hypothetical protein